MNNYFLDQNIQNAFYTLHDGTHTVIRPKKTTTRRERIGSKMDKYLLESITAAILVSSIIIRKMIKEILPIDKNLSYRKQLELYGHLGEIIEDMKLIKKTTSEIQMWLIIKKIILQAAECLPKRKVGAQSTHTKKESMDHKLVKVVADIIKQIRVNNADMHDNNVMQLLAK
ncbi:hypothetical protein G9A89_011155 [Geosiphon pyriformis]|nr:hypothetical protein G9A89_011155 [Geosiphon pyriformis]